LIFSIKRMQLSIYISFYISYLLQSLNISVFSPLKHTYKKLVEEIIAADNNYLVRRIFYLSIYLLIKRYLLARIYAVAL